MEYLSINDLKIDLVRKDIKNIHLAVYPPSGRIRIAAPLNIKDDTIRLFVISKLGWIRRNQRKFDKQERVPQREYKQRESHYFQGRRYLLNIIEKEATPFVQIKDKKHIDLYVRPYTPRQKYHEIITEWYRNELRKQIPGIVEKWEKALSVKVDSWQIKQMKTKWGSCNIDKRKILINLELAKKPEYCLEYIIVHEMVHLLERHHNERFIFYMDSFLPDWKHLKLELNNLPVSHADWSY